jgi:methionyl-tRNA formyltransferase
VGKLNFGDIDKFILFGGGNFLFYVAKRLSNDSYQVIVFSSKRHLNEDLDGKCLSELLHDNNIACYESRDINTDSRVSENISDKTIGLSLGAAWIFKEDFMRHFSGKFINMHGTRLPQNRGGGGFSWQILRENRLGYCLIHQIDPGIDTGNIIKYKEFIYPKFCRTPKDFVEYYFQESVNFFNEFISEIKAKANFNCMGQPEYLSIYWPRLNTYKHAFIDWNWSLKHIECFINAFDEPYSGASTFINGKRVFLKDCYADYNDGPFHPFQQGIIYRKGEEVLFVAVNEGTLIVKKVLSQDGQDVMNDIKIGDRFFTPVKYLESAKLYRAIYTPEGLRGE